MYVLQEAFGVPAELPQQFSIATLFPIGAGYTNI
jgi:hypothetical protein